MKAKDMEELMLQSAHTSIELIAGVFGSRMGFTARYEPKMEGMRPDWLFLDQAAKPHFFGEVLNFHMNEGIEKAMEEAYQTRGWWHGELPDSRKRLYSSLKGKVEKYKKLADTVNIPFVVFVHAFFNAFLHSKEIESCLTHQGYGLFRDFSQLTGVYHLDAASPVGRERVDPGYRFHFYANPHAARPLTLAHGLVPLPIPEPPERKGSVGG